MLFDVVFLGFPVAIAICLAVTAVQHGEVKYWHPAFSLFAYSAFYLAGGREVLIYLSVGACIGGGWASTGFQGLPPI